MPTVKIIEVQQAKLCASYKNTKLKLLKSEAAIQLITLEKLK
jgi:hypothetical protein